jgi:hypothetical protein
MDVVAGKEMIIEAATVAGRALDLEHLVDTRELREKVGASC